jgi:hypothetical protein
MNKWASSNHALVLALAVTLAGCGQKRVMPPGVESESGCPEACAHMQDNFSHCPEGQDPQCVSGCEATYRLGYVWTDDSSGPLCIVRATTEFELSNCNVACKR